MNRLVLLVACSLTFALGLGCGNWLSMYTMPLVGFWDVKFIQIVDIVVGITIAVFVVSVISRHLSYGLKKRELVAGCISDYDAMLVRVYDAFTTYSRAPSKDSAHETLRLHKIASNSLHVMIRILRTSNTCNGGDLSEGFECQYLKLKTAMTDSPFGTDRRPITDSARLDKIDAAYRASRGFLVETKLALYK